MDAARVAVALRLGPSAVPSRTMKCHKQELAFTDGRERTIISK
jgi:hypothetical protein